LHARSPSKRAAFGYGGAPGMTNPGPDYTTDLSRSRELRQRRHRGRLRALAAPIEAEPAPGPDQTIFRGAVNAPVPGRTDHLPVHVASGSYVIPADIVGAMGEGNTDDRLQGDRRCSRRAVPRPTRRPVPVVIAGGEYVLDPAQVAIAGQGDVDVGHQILDAFVKQFRAKTIKTLSSLPGPKKD
jgi:hypothetical protein